MKEVKIDALLDSPRDGVVFQNEWAVGGGPGRKGLLLLIALFAGNIGPGVYMVSCCCRFYPGLVAGFLIVLFGYALTHLLFLGRMERFWRAIAKPQTSWISRGFVVANFFLLFGLLSVVLPDSSLLGAITPLGFISAFLLALYPAFLFSCIRAIPFWNSIVLAPLFIVQAFGSGIAMVFLLSHLPGSDTLETDTLLRYEAILVTLSAALIAIYLFGRYRRGAAGRASVEQLLFGEFRNRFLWGALACEIVIPLSMVLLAMLDVMSMDILVAAELIQLTGIFFFKYCLLNAGAYNPLCDDQVGKTLSNG